MTEKEDRRGLVMVFTGPGKGKTTAAFGAALRAAGNGLRVLIVQFIKSHPTGEALAVGKVPEIEVRTTGQGMIRGGRPRPEDLDAARNAWESVVAAVQFGDYDLLVLDEVGPALKYGLLETEQVLNLLEARPYRLHLILTGRDMPPAVIEAADTATTLVETKHHFAAGIKSQPGIEY
jgi:cob(I)alamin adenosyltransferase